MYENICDKFVSKFVNLVVDISLSCSYRIEIKIETKIIRQRRKRRKEVSVPMSAKKRETALSLVPGGNVPDHGENEE